LISTNAILTLGYVGVNLRYTQNRRTVQLVMQIFQQRFCTPPSALDAIIVDQMANIVIAGCVSNLPMSVTQNLLFNFKIEFSSASHCKMYLVW